MFQIYSGEVRCVHYGVKRPVWCGEVFISSELYGAVWCFFFSLYRVVLFSFFSDHTAHLGTDCKCLNATLQSSVHRKNSAVSTVYRRCTPEPPKNNASCGEFPPSPADSSFGKKTIIEYSIIMTMDPTRPPRGYVLHTPSLQPVSYTHLTLPTKA